MTSSPQDGIPPNDVGDTENLYEPVTVHDSEIYQENINYSFKTEEPVSAEVRGDNYSPKIAYNGNGIWERVSDTGIFGWFKNKPKLGADIPEDPLSPKRKKTTVATVAIQLLILTLIMVVSVIAVLWIIFGLTFMPTVKAGGSLYIVDRTAWVQGEAPPGSFAIVIPEPVERNFLWKLENLIPHDFKGSNSLVRIEGKDLVSGDYIVACISGGCVNESPPGIEPAKFAFTVDPNNVLGQAKAEISFLSIKKVS